LYDDENIIGFMSVIHFPHPKVKDIKRVHRLVILPDYQGIGLGVKFLEFIGEIYKKQGYQFRIITTAKNLIYALNKSKKWTCERYSKGKINKKNQIKTKKTLSIETAKRNTVKTATFKML